MLFDPSAKGSGEKRPFHTKRKSRSRDFVLVAGVGLERPTRVAYRFLRHTQYGLKASRFGSTASREATPWLPCGAYPRPPAASLPKALLKLELDSLQPKEKVARCATFSFGCGGGT